MILFCFYIINRRKIEDPLWKRAYVGPMLGIVVFFFCPQEWSTCFMNYKLSTELKPGQISLLPQSSCWLSSHRILNYTISHQNHIHFLNHLKISLSSRKIWLRRSCTTLLGTHQGHAGFPMLIGKRCSSACTENVCFVGRIMHWSSCDFNFRI